jgi:hypothetical protein
MDKTASLGSMASQARVVCQHTLLRNVALQNGLGGCVGGVCCSKGPFSDDLYSSVSAWHTMVTKMTKEGVALAEDVGVERPEEGFCIVSID